MVCKNMSQMPCFEDFEWTAAELRRAEVHKDRDHGSTHVSKSGGICVGGQKSLD